MNIDARIKADTLPICSTEHSYIRVMNDSRWPWLILLPIDSDSTELHQLNVTQRAGFLDDVSRCSEVLQQHTRCKSVNVAMLGNVVSALHCHVVARQTDDLNWPKPVWGFETSVGYGENTPEALIRVVQEAFVD